VSGAAKLLRQDPGGTPRELEPGDLHVFAQPIDPAHLGLLTALARNAGDIIEHDGQLLLGLGEAALLALPRGLDDKDAATGALRLLAELDGIEQAPALPIALGALPFVSSAPAALHIPALVVIGRAGREPMAVAVGTPAELTSQRGAFPFGGSEIPTLADERAPDEFELVSVRSHDDYRARVEHAVAAVHEGILDKVVLAREVLVRANRPFPRRELLLRLRQLHPSCATFAIGGFLGASPELLVTKHGRTVFSQPLAGTVGRSGDPDEDRRLATGLLASDKERAEHRFVVDAIATALDGLGAAVEPTVEPHLLELRNVVHLATRIVAVLGPTSTLGVLDLVAALHPTPAVGGVPREAALAYLSETEDLERDRYAGPVGWFDAAGDGEFFVGIRSAMIDGNTARLLAGAGIVAGSDPAAELAETQLKLQALLAAAVRP
jgi:menaquinone-specific isochorismate synthase